MSTRILGAYLYDKPEAELMKELNSIRDAFHEYLKADIKKDPNKWMRWGKSIVDRGKETGEDSLHRAVRYIKAGLETVEVGNPLDVAATLIAFITTRIGNWRRSWNRACGANSIRPAPIGHPNSATWLSSRKRASRYSPSSTRNPNALWCSVLK